MPQKSKTKSRRPYRKGKKGAKNMVRKMNKTKAKKNMDTFFLKAKFTGVISPVQGTLVSNYLYFCPSLFAPTDATFIANNSEFKMYQSLYDKVRINSMKLTVRPKANVLDQVVAQQDTTYTLTGDGVIHTCVDRDDKPGPNVARISRYPSYRKYSLLKTFSRSVSIRYPTGVWLDCQNLQSSAGRLQDLGMGSSICLYAENLVEDAYELANEPWADYELEFNCVFQGKTSASVSFDPSTGAITIKPDTAPNLSATQTHTVLRGGFNDLRYDLSGNLVPVTDSDTP